MYLVDTSVWIDYLREKNNIATDFFSDVIDNNIPFGITSAIYQEIIQGAKTQKDWNKLVKYLSTQYFFHPTDLISTYEKAGKLYFDCRRQETTPRSTIHCL